MHVGIIPRAQPTGFANHTPIYPKGIDKSKEPPILIIISVIPDIKGINAFPMALTELLYKTIIPKKMGRIKKIFLNNPYIFLILYLYIHLCLI